VHAYTLAHAYVHVMCRHPCQFLQLSKPFTLDADGPNSCCPLGSLQAPPAPTSHVLMQQPTWCKLRPENFAMLIEHATPGTPENVLFVLGAPPQQQLQPQQQHGASGVAAGSGGNGSSAANGSSVPAPVHSSEASVVMAELHNKSMNAAAQAAQQPVGRRLAR
jgi:hypothetical protein